MTGKTGKGRQLRSACGGMKKPPGSMQEPAADLEEGFPVSLT